MKQTMLFLCGLFLLGGCCCNCNSKKDKIILPALQQETTLPPTSNPSEITSPQISPAAVPAKKVAVSQPAASTQLSAKTLTPSPAQKPAEIKQEPAPLPAAPVPDQAVFKDEQLIDLNGRLLNPLANQTPLTDKDTPAPWKGEQLKYGVYYALVKAGTAYIKNRGLIDADGKKAYVIQTSAFSAPVIDTVFKVRDINLSWLDAKDFYSLGYSQSLREGKYKRDEWVRFDYPNKKYQGQVQKKSSPRSFSGELTQPVLDMLTSLYYVRAQKLTPGHEVIFDIINREEKYPLVVKVIGRETVKTEAGKFKCLVVEPQFRGEGIFVSKGKSLKVWLTDDAYKMPVKMKAEVFIGSVSAELLEYKRN